jgi:predicted RNA-binding Zn ribbon-like protein
LKGFAMVDRISPAIFIADDLGLDFLNSFATPVDVPVEWIGNAEGLLNWLEQARLVPNEVLNSFRSTALPGELDAVAAQARALREWFRGFVDAHKGKPLGGSALEALAPLNQILARDEEFAEIVRSEADGDSDKPVLELRMQRRWRSPDTLLLPIARAIAQCVSSADFSYVKHCEGHSCTLIFLDQTNRRSRRWCSMAICGNRAKQAAHRARAQHEAH